MTIAFITGNERKFMEAQLILPGIERLSMELPEIQSLDSREIIAAKLRAARDAYAGPVFVDDVALELSCLGGFPGPLIKWWLGSAGPKRIWDVCSALGDARAVATCTIGYAEGNEVAYFAGTVNGSIIVPREGPTFGWDHVFLPDGETRTYSQMSAQEKNGRSHRGMALRALDAYLRR